MAEGALCEVWFYHLERTSVEQALPELLDKTLSRGWRAVVRASGRERLDALDEALWAWRDDSFLAHGQADEAHADRQPILLTTAEERPNGADVLFLLDGAEAGDLTPYARCVIMMDGSDQAAVAASRGRWKAFAAQGLPVSYWRQSEEGRWEKKA